MQDINDHLLVDIHNSGLNHHCSLFALLVYTCNYFFYFKIVFCAPFTFTSLNEFWLMFHLRKKLKGNVR